MSSNKIYVKLNPEKGGSFYQDPSNPENIISSGEIKEFEKTSSVQKVVNAGGLTILSKDDESVKEYLASLKSNKETKAKSETASTKKLKDELTDEQLKNAELEAKIKELESSVSGLKEELNGLQEENETLATKLAAVPEEKDAKGK